MKSIVLFDGVCNFCNSSVNFILERDKTDRFRFSALQSGTGRGFIEKFGLSEIDSIVLVEGERAYTHSTAALRIARGLGGFWRAFYVFVIVPRPVRDCFYKLFARNRYRLFGQKDECMIPTPAVRQKFLD